jgi:hypothetical protein
MLCLIYFCLALAEPIGLFSGLNLARAKQSGTPEHVANRSRLPAEEDVPLGETLQYRRAIERVAVVNQRHVAVQLNKRILAYADPDGPGLLLPVWRYMVEMGLL